MTALHYGHEYFKVYLEENDTWKEVIACGDFRVKEDKEWPDAAGLTFLYHEQLTQAGIQSMG